MKQLRIYLLASALLSPFGLVAQTDNNIPSVSSEALINLQQQSTSQQSVGSDADSEEVLKKKAEEEKAKKKAEKEAQKAAQKKQKEEEKARKEAEKEAQKVKKEEEKARKKAEKEAQKAEKARIGAEKAQKEAEKAQKEAEKAQEEAVKAQNNADEKTQAGAAPAESVEPAGGVATPNLSKTAQTNTLKVVAVDAQQGNPKKMQKQHDENENKIKKRLDDIAQHPDAPVYLLMMAEHIEENWIAKPFSGYSAAKLEMAILAYERVAELCDRQNDQKKLLDAAKRLNGLYEDAQLYEAAYLAVNNAYDKKMVDPLVSRMKKLRDGTNQNKYPDKSQDLKALTYQLIFYDAKVDIFKDLIDNFDNELKEAQDVKGSLNQLKNEYQEDIEAIRENLWLKNQFDEYIKDPLHSPVRETIKSLVTE